MPLDPHNFLRVLHDDYTPVRNREGRLLGCIPRISDAADDMILGQEGRQFDLMIAAQACVCLRDGQSPFNLIDFVPLDDDVADLLTPAADDEPTLRDDPSIGEAV